MRETLARFLKALTTSWHFKVFLCNFVVLLIFGSFNLWIGTDGIPDSSDSILYIVHVYALRNSLVSFLQFPSIDMLQYAGIPVLGAGPFIPFIPIALLALFGSVVFAYEFLMIVVLAAAGGTMSYYTYSLTKSRIASFVAAIVYVWNPPMFITAIVEGHFDLVWSYMLIPLLFLTTLNALRKSSLTNLGLAGATFGLILLGHAQILFLVGPFYLIYVIVLGVLFPASRISREPRTFLVTLAKKVGSLGAILLVGFLLSSIRLLPLIFETSYRYSDAPTGDIYYGLAGFSPPSVFYALLMVTSGFESGSDGILAAIPLLLVLAFIILILAIIALALDFRNDLTLTSFILGVLAAFFAAGPLAPQFFQPFMLFYDHVPFFSEVRTPGRFAIMVAFFWAFLCGVAASKISERVSKRDSRISHISITRKRTTRNRTTILKTYGRRADTRIRVMGSLFIILMLGTSPFLTPFFSTYHFSPQLAIAYETIRQQDGDFRFVGFPVATYYPTTVYGISTNLDCYAPILTGKANLFGDGSGASSYLVDFTYLYLNSLVASGISCSLGKLLGLYNVKWVILHQPMLLNDSVQSILADPTLRVIYSSPDSSEIVLEVIDDPYPLIYSARSMLLIGGLESISALTSLDQFNLNSSARWTFNIASQLSSLDISKSFISMFDAVGLRENDLTSIVSLRYGISAVELLASTAITNNGWQKQNYHENFSGRLIPQYFSGFGVDLDKKASSISGSYIEANGKADLRFNIDASSSGSYEFWIRPWFSNVKGNLSLIIDESTPWAYEMNVSSSEWQFGWHWVNAGTCSISAGTHSLTIRNTGNEVSSVDALMVVPTNLVTNLTNDFATLLQQNSVNFIHVLDAHSSFKYSAWNASLAWKGNTSTGRCLSTYTDGAEAISRVFMPTIGNYSLAIRLLEAPNRGNISIYLDNTKLIDFRPEGPEKWVTLVVNSSIPISQGYHNFTVRNTGILGNDIDKLILSHTFDGHNLADFFSEDSGNVYAYSETGPARYATTIEISKPSFIVLNAAFHPGWRAFNGTSEYEPTTVSYFQNGFYINGTGKLNLVIAFGYNPPRIIGLCLSIIGIVLLAVIFICGKDERKRM